MRGTDYAFDWRKLRASLNLKRRNTRLRHLVAACTLVLAARLFSFWLFPLCSEDAFITFHASLDHSWLKACTSPLWALVCGIGDPPTVARIVTLAVDLLAVGAMAWRVAPAGLWAFVALWVSPFFTGSAVSGLETHVATCLMILGMCGHAGAFAGAAALRPDTALLAMAVSKRKWPPAVAGTCIYLGLNLLLLHRGFPQTVMSKAAVYGFQGLALFWWYLVSPLSVAAVWCAKRITRWQMTVACLAVLVLTFTGSWNTLVMRAQQEQALWQAGAFFETNFHPKGTVLLEPAGMIPYQCRGLEVMDEVGLLTPWMAQRRKEGPGWRTDALAVWQPEWLMLRTREYVYPQTWDRGHAYYMNGDEKVPGYGAVGAPGMVRVPGSNVMRGKLVSSNLIILRKK